METFYVVRNNVTGEFVCLIPSDEFDFFWESAEFASRFLTRYEGYKVCDMVKELCLALGEDVPSLSVDAV